eukprot:5155962-Heterocapsa_arctica.AAC.1
MDKVVAGLLRPMLRGKGSWMTEAGMRTLSRTQLRAYWRIPSVEGLIRCLRLGWLQKMIEDKE